MENQNDVKSKAKIEMSAVKVDASSASRNLVTIELPPKAKKSNSVPPNSATLHSASDSPSVARVIGRNVVYMWEQLRFLVDGRSRMSLFVPLVCGTIIVFYLFNALMATTHKTLPMNTEEMSIEMKIISTTPESQLINTLTFTPGSILSPRHWLWSALASFTYPFIELHWWLVLLDVIVVTMGTTLIEPLWGQRELVTFFVIVNICVAFCSTAHYIVLYSLYSDVIYLYGVRIYGLSGYCAAVCVTVKQLLPESVLIATSLGKLKNNNVPLTALLVGLIFYLLNLIDGLQVVNFFYGLIISWVYLRFFQFHHSNGHRGDLSDGFAFATFFPNVLKPVVAVVCNSIYEFFVKIRLCPITNRQYQGFRILSERLTQEHSNPGPSRHFKHHQSGDYQHLHQPTVQTM
ncbi:transmembrane protein 115-like protein [Leptotrombidium deliense]|uniref:Transmembrane protein 115-like protein n=1 Tax=Leptotrombidium deliense TaxID=299467 RepID=A0A443SWY9_9ACAR|nr:transmembrane protein 115-like protein [Leptotrombidium deliense]